MRLSRTLTTLTVALLVAAAAQPRGEERPEFWQLVEAALEARNRGGPARAVLEHMAGVGERRAGVARRTERIGRSLAEPWSVPALAAELRDGLAADLGEGGEPDLAALLARGADHRDLDLEGLEDEGLLEDMDLALESIARDELRDIELLEALSGLMRLAHRALELSLEDLESEARAALFTEAADFREAWYRSHFPGGELSEARGAVLGRWIAGLRAGSHDTALALAVARRLARLTDPKLRGSLNRRLRRARGEDEVPGFGGDLRAVVGTDAADRVVLGGRRETIYTGHAALVIDLGGDDRYERAAVVDAPEGLVSVVIDLGGDDTYTGACAAATGGLALLWDEAGDDAYTSKRFSQGAATYGVAALVDREGEDRYAMEDYGQGHALEGVALLLDLAGDDTYQAWAFAQGGGLGPGFCGLLDVEGDDSYLADLHWPDVYGDSGPEIYHGASQGYSTGLRSGGGVAGGTAVLLDLGDGEDRYQAGNFSQGGGYFFSFGLMYDGGGDDENLGARYSQGFGVHQATGVRWDSGGNDSYTCRSVAHAGMAWDEGVGFLLEDGGDDVYQVGDLALGGAAQTGVAVAIDRDGKDSYRSSGSSQGGTGSSEYHDKPSLGVLIDLGGDEDTYSQEERGDDTLRCDERGGVFIDSSARSFGRARAALR